MQALKQIMKHSDPSHGWYAVPRRVLAELGIADKVSGCSYQRGKTVYLEEDCDATLFFRMHVGKFGVEPTVKESRNKRSNWFSSPVRSFAPYRPTAEEILESRFVRGESLNQRLIVCPLCKHEVPESSVPGVPMGHALTRHGNIFCDGKSVGVRALDVHPDALGLRR